MEMDEYLGQAKWPILEIIAKGPHSPIEIAQIIGTSVAYVSQQLKLLEAVGLVQKSKTGEFLKGKPRSLYSLTRDLIHITSLVQGQPQKKSIEPTRHQEVIMNIWMYENLTSQKDLEKLYWTLEPLFDRLQGMYMDLSASKEKLLLITKDKKLKHVIDQFFKKHAFVDYTILTSFETLKKKRKYVYIFYHLDSHSFMEDVA